VKSYTKNLKLEKSIHDNINRYITTLKELETERILKSTSASLISDLSMEFNYPKSHLKFIFKYYCHLSLTDYLNLMKLIHALTLINEGYLTNFTFESLAETCHFNSRTSFYRHFKKHLGVSPSQYKLFIQ
jgi:AraC-like DNA-binding protein